MNKIIILFASLTGNTELMTQIIADYLTDRQYKVDIKAFDFDVINIVELAEYDAILVGTYTWDDGSLPYEVEDFYDELEDIDIKNKVFGVFGSADSFYETYGGAIELVGDRAVNLGANVLPERLKVDIEPDKKDIERCKDFARMVSDELEKTLGQ